MNLEEKKRIMIITMGSKHLERGLLFASAIGIAVSLGCNKDKPVIPSPTPKPTPMHSLQSKSPETLFAINTASHAVEAAKFINQFEANFAGKSVTEIPSNDLSEYITNIASVFSATETGNRIVDVNFVSRTFLVHQSTDFFSLRDELKKSTPNSVIEDRDISFVYDKNWKVFINLNSPYFSNDNNSIKANPLVKFRNYMLKQYSILAHSDNKLRRLIGLPPLQSK